MKLLIKWFLCLLCLFNGSIYALSVPPAFKECVVLLSNKKYFPKFLHTAHLLATKGKYRGDICLVIGDDLVGDELLSCDLIKTHRIIVKHFPDLQFPSSFMQEAQNLPNSGKLFQYHKFHLFNTYFKQWDTILYIDCGITIYSDIRPLLNTKQADTLLAHSDAYPTYCWKLQDQFSQHKAEYYDKLRRNFHLDIDYFQTTMMLYDTRIIEENTFQDLYHLAVEYPISRTNDQGIIALYFTNIKPLWKQIPVRNDQTCFYDYLRRNKKDRYIMSKV